MIILRILSILSTTLFPKIGAGGERGANENLMGANSFF